MIRRTKIVLIKTIEIAIIIAAIVLSTSYIYFRYFKETTVRVSEPISSALEKEVHTSLEKLDSMVGVQIVKADLKKNVRYLIHSHWQTPELQKIHDEFSIKSITLEVPVFSDDSAQNMRIIKLMNHEFDCVPFVDTLNFKFAPQAANDVAVTCSISIPPAFTEFKGMVSVLLSRVPTDAEKLIIKEVLTEISDKIYKEINVKK